MMILKNFGENTIMDVVIIGYAPLRRCNAFPTNNFFVDKVQIKFPHMSELLKISY